MAQVLKLTKKKRYKNYDAKRIIKETKQLMKQKDVISLAVVAITSDGKAHMQSTDYSWATIGAMQWAVTDLINKLD